MSSGNGVHAPAASGPAILESVRSLHEAVNMLAAQNEQIRLNIAHLTDAIHQLGLIVRSEQEHTRRALLIAGGGGQPSAAADLQANERGA